MSRDLDQADYTHLTEPHVVTLLDREAEDLARRLDDLAPARCW